MCCLSRHASGPAADHNPLIHSIPAEADRVKFLERTLRRRTLWLLRLSQLADVVTMQVAQAAGATEGIPLMDWAQTHPSAT
jgi:hypothetical protein